MQKSLKPFRLVISILLLVVTSYIFVDIHQVVTGKLADTVLYFQFVPSSLQFLTTFSLVATGFIVVLILTLLFGRVYCSFLCPLGVFQDVVIFIAGKFKSKRKRRFKFKKAHDNLRYIILAFVVLYFIVGSFTAFDRAFGLNILDPYSNFGRIMVNLVRPVYAGINNALAFILGKFDIYTVYPVHIKGISFVSLVFPAVILLLVLVLSITRGRLYCNTVCPVGSFLGVISKISLFRIKINKDECTQCGLCAFACKAECINVKEQSVDFSRCVACFNCIRVCSTSDIKYKLALNSTNGETMKEVPAQKEGAVNSKRAFIGQVIAYGALLAGMKNIGKIKAASRYPANESPPPGDGGHEEHYRDDLVPVNKKHPVSPPGSISLEHMKDKCTACHLCVSVCPMDVIQPSFLEYGLTGMMVPMLDYEVHYCTYECVKCAEVCPTGAILPISVEEKKTIQLGKVRFIEDNCVVKLEETACGSCSEHCPTQAVKMVPYKNGITIPETDVEICIGCGACEHACPMRPHRAIYVESNTVHLEASMPETEKLENDLGEDEFPF